MPTKQGARVVPKAKATTASGKVGPARGAVKAAAKAVPVTPPEAKYKVGDIAKFAGYRGTVEEPLFTETGELVYIHSLGERDITEGPRKGTTITVFNCVRYADMEAAIEDPELETVTAEQLTRSELRVHRVREPEPEYHPVEHSSIVKLLQANSLTPEIKRLQEQEAQTEFEIGGLLAFVRYERQSEVAELGYTDTDADGNEVTEEGGAIAMTAWGNYLRGEFNISERTAEEYVKIYRAFSAVEDFDPKLLAKHGGIGWSKAALIAGYIPQTEDAEERKAAFDEIIELARDNDIRTLRDVMKTKYVDDTGRTPTGATVSKVKRVKFGPFFLEESEATGVEMVMEQAAKMLRLEDNPNELFNTIVRQWGNTNLTGPVVSRIERAVKGKIAAPATAIRPKGGTSGAVRQVRPRGSNGATAST